MVTGYPFGYQEIRRSSDRDVYVWEGVYVLVRLIAVVGCMWYFPGKGL